MAKDPNYSENFSIFTPSDNTKTYTGEAVKLFYIPVREAVLWDQNPKKHDLQELKRSIEQNGFRDPPTWDNVLQGMVEGNGRTTALREMEKEGRKPPRGIVVHKDEGYWCMPVLFGIDAESQSQAIRYAIDHNNLTLAGAGFTHDDMARMWDKDLYINVLQEIDDGIMPVSLDGFDLKAFAGIEDDTEKGDVEEIKEDLITQLQEKWQVRPGDLWVIKSSDGKGEHKILCGDCTKRDIVAILMQDEKGKMTLTDPPYGISYTRDGSKNSKGRGKAYAADKPQAIANDHFRGQEQQDFIEDAFTAWKDFAVPGSGVYMFSASGKEGYLSALGAELAGIHFQSQLIWVKNRFSMGRNDYHWRHEVCWYGWWDGGSHIWYGGRDKDTILNANNLTKTLHPNEKPLDLLEMLLENSSKPGDIVLEPFCGSGSTVLACDNKGRYCRATEIIPGFVALELERLELRGLTPVRAIEGDGDINFGKDMVNLKEEK